MTAVHVVSRSISPYGKKGGLESSSRWHADSIGALGYDVRIYTSDDRDELIIESESTTTQIVAWRRIFPYKKSVVFAFEYVWWLYRTLSLLRSNALTGDVVYLHGSAAFLASLLGKKHSRSLVVIINPHGMEEFGPLGLHTLVQRPLLRLMQRWGARHCDAVIATDRNMVSDVEKNLRVSPEKVVHIPNGVPIEDFPFTEATSIGRTVLKLVSVGRLTHNKGYDIMSEAVGELASTPGLSVMWTHFGTGEEREKVLSLFVKCGGDLSAIEILENVDDCEVKAGVSGADLFVQPSRYEGSSLTTLESMALGTVVVGTNVGGIPDKIRDGATGFLCSPDSVEELRAAIWDAATSCNLSQISLNARTLVENSFSVGALAYVHRDLFMSLKSSKDDRG